MELHGHTDETAVSFGTEVLKGHHYLEQMLSES